MNMKIIGAVVTLGIVAAVGYYALQVPAPSTSMVKPEMSTSEAVMEKKEDITLESSMVKSDETPVADAMMKKEVVDTEGVTTNSSENRYVPYTKEAFEKNTSPRKVLFFYANWCSTCRPADADFEKNITQLPSDLTVFRVNYGDTDTDNDEKALATMYGVTYQHTFVQIDETGKELTKWNGGSTADLLTKLK